MTPVRMKYNEPQRQGCRFETPIDDPDTVFCSYTYADGTILTGIGKDEGTAFEDVKIQYHELLALLAPPGFPESWSKK